MILRTVFLSSEGLSRGSIRFSLYIRQIWLIIKRCASFSEGRSLFAANKIERNILRFACKGFFVIKSLISLNPF